MRRRIILAIILLTSFIVGQSQEKLSKDLNLDIYGFVRNDLIVDTYKGIDAGYDLFYLFPLYAGQDQDGEDINECTSATLSAMSTRLGVKVDGPEIFGAKTNAVVEFDFLGITKSEPTLFRIRHANVTFNWENSKLLVGQTWHPFFGGSAYPIVAGLNTGAPFQAFNRSPQIRYDYNVGQFQLSGAAVYENQYTSKGLEAGGFVTGNQAQRNAVMPELVLTAEYHHAGVKIGVGAEVKRIKPCMTTVGTEGSFKLDETLTSAGFMTYIQYKKEKFSFLAKGFYGQNMTHLTQVGGYGITSVDEATGAMTYTNYTNYTSLLNVVYGKKWQVGVFLGYGANLGTGEALYEYPTTGSALTKGVLPNVQDLARIAPHVSLNLSKIRLSAEYEMTTANYGIGSFQFDDGLYADTHRTTNNRIIAVMTYFF